MLATHLTAFFPTKCMSFVVAVMPPELLEDMVNMIARNPLLHGDMIESSSPADIIFWLVHPALDRMLAAKRLPSVKVGAPHSYFYFIISSYFLS